MSERKAVIERDTLETGIRLELCLDGRGLASIDSGVGFMDHMLTLFASHGGFDITLKCEGDTYVDFHHSVEDIGIALGDALREALGERRGITRYGSVILPMDEALVLAAIDCSGRFTLNFDVDIPTQRVGSFDTELVEEFWYAFASHALINLHILKLAGRNSHHIIEAVFKAVARALSQAVAVNVHDPERIPSTKGLL